MEHSVKHWITEKAQLWWKEAWFGRKYFDESEADLSFLVLTLLDRDVCDVLLFWVVLVRGSLRGWAFFVLSVHFSIKTWSSGIKTSTMSSPQSQIIYRYSHRIGICWKLHEANQGTQLCWWLSHILRQSLCLSLKMIKQLNLNKIFIISNYRNFNLVPRQTRTQFKREKLGLSATLNPSFF